MKSTKSVQQDPIAAFAAAATADAMKMQGMTASHTMQNASAPHAVQSNWADQFVKEDVYSAQVVNTSRVQSIPQVHRPQQHHPAMFFPQYPYQVQTPQLQTTQTQLNEEDMTAARRMVEMLRTSGNPKFENSQFVNFVDKLTTGDLQIDDGNLIDREGNTVDADDLFVPNDFDASMDKIWREMRAEGVDWASAPQMDLKPNVDRNYEFSQTNPFINHPEPRMELSRKFVNAGNTSDAILAAEAAARLNPEDAEAWRELGELHASQDNDSQAILCFEKSHSADPYNLQSLLNLGISLSNELDTFQALHVLRRWLRGREEFFSLVPAGDDYLSVDNLRNDLHDALVKASVLSADADVWAALGVVRSLSRDFTGAAHAFLAAVQLRSDDAFLWNRLGAVLANGGKSAIAREAYAHALRLRPAFARAWSNLGVAHANLGQHAKSILYFLAGLRTAPKAENLWSVVFMTLANFFPENSELGEFCSARDIEGLGAALGGIPTKYPSDSSPDETILRVKAELST